MGLISEAGEAGIQHPVWFWVGTSAVAQLREFSALWACLPWQDLLAVFFSQQRLVLLENGDGEACLAQRVQAGAGTWLVRPGTRMGITCSGCKALKKKIISLLSKTITIPLQGSVGQVVEHSHSTASEVPWQREVGASAPSLGSGLST